MRSSSLVSQRVGNQTSHLLQARSTQAGEVAQATLIELAHHSSVVIGRSHRTEGSGSQWRSMKECKLEAIRVDGPLRVDDLMAACEAARLNLGLGFLPQFLALSTRA